MGKLIMPQIFFSMNVDVSQIIIIKKRLYILNYLIKNNCKAGS